MKAAADLLDELCNETTYILSEGITEELILPAMEQYGKEQYNQAIEDIAEKLPLQYKEFILNLKK